MDDGVSAWRPRQASEGEPPSPVRSARARTRLASGTPGRVGHRRARGLDKRAALALLRAHGLGPCTPHVPSPPRARRSARRGGRGAVLASGPSRFVSISSR